ncbi:MAG: alcohol dehydrogenase, partial [Paraglaciecola chathamensis]
NPAAKNKCIFIDVTQQRSVSSSPVGSPATIKKMLEFARLHDIKPVIETYSFDQINQALERLRTGDVKYRIVLKR